MAASGFCEDIALSICDSGPPSVWRKNRSMSADAMASFELPSFLRTCNAESSADDTYAPIDRDQAQALLDAFNQRAETEPDVARAFESLDSVVVPAWIDKQIEDITTVVGQRSQAIAIVMRWVSIFVAANLSETGTETLCRQAARAIRTALAFTAESDIQAAMDRIDAAYEMTSP